MVKNVIFSVLAASSLKCKFFRISKEIILLLLGYLVMRYLKSYFQEIFVPIKSQWLILNKVFPMQSPEEKTLLILMVK